MAASGGRGLVDPLGCGAEALLARLVNLSLLQARLA
jgi:hypothetical protein